MQSKKDLEKRLTAERLQLPKLEKEELRLRGAHLMSTIALEKCRQNIEILTSQIAELG